MQASKTSSFEPTTTSIFNTVDWVAWVLVVVGAVNWGLIGLFEFDLVSALFGPMSAVTRIVYVLVGVAGVYFLTFPFRRRV